VKEQKRWVMRHLTLQAGRSRVLDPIRYTTTPHQAHNPNNYGRALMSALPQAITPNPHTNLLNVYIQIANKMGFKKSCSSRKCEDNRFRAQLNSIPPLPQLNLLTGIRDGEC
jgi:hypothetical protein